MMVLGAVLAMMFLVGACGSDDDEGGGAGGGASGGAESSDSADAKTVGLIMDVLRNDKSFGQATFEGATRAAEDLNLELSVVDNVGADPKKAETATVNLARESDILVNGAQAMTGVMPRIAGDFPDKQFGVYAVAVEGPDNLHWVYQDWYPLAYVAGIVAGRTTKSNVVGFVGGGEIPPTIAGEAAFKTAIKSVNPDIKVLSTITGDFNDPAKGRDATSAQIAQDADVVYSFLDAGHEGAVAAAKRAGDVKLISVVLPKCDFSQGVEIGDTVSRQDELVYELIKGMVEGGFKNTVFGIQDPEVADFKFCEGEGSPELKQEIEDVRAKFTSGELETPDELQSAQSGGD